ncbi:hypothetical protein YTPLAS18_36360 [Nitrospira sp.]|nr:hypothetical protein YTPLAS18_36360 [Nitrospira sp.]
MDNVRETMARAEAQARLLDELLWVGGTRLKIGLDPCIGLIPVFGDLVVTAWGVVILIHARRLDLPWPALAHMAYNLLKNGLIGAIPFVGDAYSIWFRSHTLNVAVMIRALKPGEDGSCRVSARRLNAEDVGGVLLLIGPILVAVFLVSRWFWDHDVSYYSILFPAPYSSGSRVY